MELDLEYLVAGDPAPLTGQTATAARDFPRACVDTDEME